MEKKNIDHVNSSVKRREEGEILQAGGISEYEGELASRESGGSIRVLDRAVSVLGFMADQKRQVGITEIAEATRLSKATVHRILSTLREYSVVLKDESGRYQMGPSVLYWADAYRKHSGLVELARPHLRQLWEVARETVHLFAFEAGEAYYIDKLDSPHPVGMRSRIGAKRDLYSTSGGRAILSRLPEGDLKAYFDRTELLPRTRNTVTNRAKLEEILSACGKRGFCEEVEENEEGIRCVGAAILDLRGYPVGAVSISAPAYRFSDRDSLAMGERISATALAISRELGYRG
jgi:IclR family acetate operon transcriptional repressor